MWSTPVPAKPWAEKAAAAALKTASRVSPRGAALAGGGRRDAGSFLGAAGGARVKFDGSDGHN